MAVSKIQFSLGTLSFSGEGEQDWLSDQLDKIIATAPKLSEIQTPTKLEKNNHTGINKTISEGFGTPLGTYLKEKRQTDNSIVMKFLIVADWLRLRGASPLNTAAVSKALKDNHQSKLSNPAEFLNQNISKGFCEKNGKDFFLTAEGKTAIGHE